MRQTQPEIVSKIAERWDRLYKIKKQLLELKQECFLNESKYHETRAQSFYRDENYGDALGEINKALKKTRREAYEYYKHIKRLGLIDKEEYEKHLDHIRETKH